ncbi:hypothetical protein AB0M35_28190 [Micromonospora sp. NPDC051196]|uniref:hypothetical protein n=1 Tax=Micromonospora sp. NPDC051196 TaxID=3155281 RepID=UPI00341725CA
MKTLLKRTARAVRTMLSRGRATTPARRPDGGMTGPLRVDAPKPLDPDPHHQRDAQAVHRQIVQLVAEMAPRGTDEGTGTALDNMINYWADGWLADIETERLNALTVVDALVGETTPRQERLRAARESALDRLQLAKENHELVRALMAGGIGPVSRRPGTEG